MFRPVRVENADAFRSMPHYDVSEVGAVCAEGIEDLVRLLPAGNETRHGIDGTVEESVYVVRRPAGGWGWTGWLG